MTDYLKADYDTDRIRILKFENLEPVSLLDADTRARVASYYDTDFREFGYAP